MMVRFLAAAALTALLDGTLSAQTTCPPHVRWQASFGAGGQEEPARILQLPDGGFLIGGSSYEPWDGNQGNKTAPSYGGYDFYIVRLDSQGQKLWDRSYGASQNEYLSAIEPTSDGGFLLGGTAYVNTSSDFFVVRIDSQGNKLWERFYGGASSPENLSAAKQTPDGGFILGGTLGALWPGTSKFWIARIDANGNKLWDATYGGDRDDSLTDVQLASDGGFFLAGYSLSGVSGSRTAPPLGSSDYWLLRIDANGTKLWDRAYGGSAADQSPRLVPAPNGDFLLVGESRSNIDGNKTVDTFGFEDFWALRLDPDGNILWQGSYGGEFSEHLRGASAVGTNGFVLCGSSFSRPTGSKTSRLFRYYDCWVVRIDAAGNQMWDASFGTTGDDGAGSVIPTADGGYAILAYSDFTNGNKTSPSFGARDFWVIKLNPDNPGDCDDDGVPNAQDLCGSTPFGALVNSNGCALEQICPCGDWPDHAAYVACVEQATAEFVNAGLISVDTRQQLLVAAEAANCPPSFVAFGLLHLPFKDTIVGGNDAQGYASFAPGTNAFFGASVVLGEADSGLFIDPTAGGWGTASANWFLDGKAYGRFQDGSNGLIVTVHATKPALETYPVDVDLSALGPTNITILKFTNGVVAYEEDVPGAVGSFAIRSSVSVSPRANPFWRMPDGSVGALFEFATEGLEGEDGSPLPDTIFIRANGPTRNVDYISKVEAIGYGNYDYFSFIDERLGMFGNRHHILNNGRFNAARWQLSVTRGVTVEFRKTSQFEADFLPIDLSTNDAGLLLTVSHGGFLRILRDTNALTVSAYFSGQFTSGGTNPSPAAGAIQVQAFRNGIISGTCFAGNDSILGRLVASNGLTPQIIGSIATGSSNSAPSIAFSVDRLATFICTNGTELTGTHFQITAVDPLFPPEDIYDLNIYLGETAVFTITGERSATAQPRLSITATDTTVTLTWPDNTRVFRLESSPTLPGGFTTVPAEPDFINNQNEVTLPRDPIGSRFFRLRSGPD